MDNHILKVVRRKGKIAPFINGWSVWDIEEKNWTEDVKSAILHAYELGRIHNEIKNIFFDCSFIIGSVWPKPKDK
jgi:hypothetical protein